MVSCIPKDKESKMIEHETYNANLRDTISPTA